jgi:hypothetical protein
MLSLRKLVLAAGIALIAGTGFTASSAYAGICDQQGRKVLIKGVWHKVVRGPRGGSVDCGPAW